MQMIHTYTKKLQDFFHQSPLTKMILYLLAWGFPIYISLIGNYISLGTWNALQALFTTHIGAFLFGTLLLAVVYLAILFFLRLIRTKMHTRPNIFRLKFSCAHKKNKPIFYFVRVFGQQEIFVQTTFCRHKPYPSATVYYRNLSRCGKLDTFRL